MDNYRAGRVLEYWLIDMIETLAETRIGHVVMDDTKRRKGVALKALSSGHIDDHGLGEDINQDTLWHTILLSKEDAFYVMCRLGDMPILQKFLARRENMIDEFLMKQINEFMVKGEEEEYEAI